MDPETFNQVLDLIQMLVIVICLVLLHRSIPAAQVNRLMDALEANARRTPTPVDDTAVGVARLFASLVTGQPVASTDAQPTPQPAPVPMTLTGSLTASPAPAVAVDAGSHTAPTELTPETESVG